jgi:hypothetical protein
VTAPLLGPGFVLQLLPSFPNRRTVHALLRRSYYSPDFSRNHDSTHAHFRESFQRAQVNGPCNRRGLTHFDLDPPRLRKGLRVCNSAHGGAENMPSDMWEGYRENRVHTCREACGDASRRAVCLFSYSCEGRCDKDRVRLASVRRSFQTGKPVDWRRLTRVTRRCASCVALSSGKLTVVAASNVTIARIRDKTGSTRRNRDPK